MAKLKKVAKKKTVSKKPVKKPLKKSKVSKAKAKVVKKTKPKKAVAKSKAVKGRKKPVKKIVKSKKPKAKKVVKAKKKVSKKPVKKSPKLKALKQKSKKRSTSKAGFKDLEKEHFLVMIEHFVNLHKSNSSGLHSLEEVERILDKYNQHFKTATEKFDAIVDYGMKKSIIPDNVFIDVNGREKETSDLYKLLTQIGKGNIKFDEAKDKMLEVYEESPGADEHLLNIDFDYNKPKK